jgi:hypothetical protein
MAVATTVIAPVGIALWERGPHLPASRFPVPARIAVRVTASGTDE